jgi:8-oxo-dGTP pyrophosphatase MutT (NUDIX family)
MQYLIYINGVPVRLMSTEAAQKLGIEPDNHNRIALYINKKKMIKQYLDLLDKRRDIQQVILHHPDPEVLWADFQACFTILEAAGGYVENAEKKLLVFLRRGSWDMPKGKIDPGETPEAAAVREVQEETGLQNITLGPFLTHTYHTYEQKGERILKKTWWYRMSTTDTTVVPQTEEDIERIEWVHPKEWLASQPVVYQNIRDVINTLLH